MKKYLTLVLISAGTLAGGLEDCVKIKNNAARLACYDKKTKERSTEVDAKPDQPKSEKDTIVLAVDKLKSEMASTLKDPDSVKFRGLTAYKLYETSSSKADVLCGEVNAKNSYGGYSGFKRFVKVSNSVKLVVPGTSYQFSGGIEDSNSTEGLLTHDLLPQLCNAQTVPVYSEP
jgi:hypothetical protein